MGVRMNKTKGTNLMKESELAKKPTQIVSNEVNGEVQEYDVPINLKSKTVNFFGANISSGNAQADDSAFQAQMDAFLEPEEMLKRLLLSSLVGAQNRSNKLYLDSLKTNNIELKNIYLKYANKYNESIPRIAEAIAKQKNTCQKIIVEKIIVEKINIDGNAKAIIGNVDNG